MFYGYGYIHIEKCLISLYFYHLKVNIGHSGSDEIVQFHYNWSFDPWTSDGSGTRKPENPTRPEGFLLARTRPEPEKVQTRPENRKNPKFWKNSVIKNPKNYFKTRPDPSPKKISKPKPDPNPTFVNPTHH